MMCILHLFCCHLFWEKILHNLGRVVSKVKGELGIEVLKRLRVAKNAWGKIPRLATGDAKYILVL